MYHRQRERERQLRLSILFARDRRFVVLEEKVLFLCECVFECATQTLAVRDTQVQSTGRSLRMRTWVWAGALCMHGWAQIMCKARQAVCRTSPSLSHRTGSIKANTCSGRVWLALHLATPKSCLLSFSHYGKQNSCESVKWFELLPFPFLPTDDDGRLERLRRGEACACGCLSGWYLARKMITRDIDVLLMKIERCECGLIVRRSSRLPQHARLVAAGEVIAERRSLTACRLEHAGAA